MGTLFTSGGCIRDDDVVRFGPLRFWAERGLIHIEDATDNSYEAVSVLTALQRTNAISEMLGNSSNREKYSEDQFDQSNRTRHQNMLDGMLVLMNRCKVQGMPSDARARRHLKNSLPKSIVVPALYGGM